ncbi:MAG: NAD(P)H-quinone oxidoreductase [Janthinobacterium lividum]
MRQVVVAAPGGPEVMRVEDGPVPVAGPGEVLVRVEAAGVNRPDVAQRQGAYPPPPGACPRLGLEVAGEVVALGEGVAGWRVGERVCALVNGGGYAEFCVAPAGQCLSWPAGYDAVRAAALPENLFTVWANLFGIGGLRAGQVALVHGGSSGIGVTAIQLGVEMGATVLVTAGSAAKCAACERLGASLAVNYRDADFVEVVRAFTGGRGVDVVLDMVGGDYTPGNLRCLADGGRLVLIAFLRGSVVKEMDLSAIMRRRLVVTGSTMRPRTAGEKAAIADALRERVWPALSAGRCAPVVERVFDLAEVSEAHALMEGSTHVGKIMLRVA